MKQEITFKNKQSLNPKPGGIFDKNQMTLKIPELIVKVDGTEISISINLKCNTESLG